ncbi:MAG TPA: cytochrome P450 [Candidatus Eisenbacteria bacterium]|nr:cytochrome P450 [Candidatus Eisenbacteria bacterium]
MRPLAYDPLDPIVRQDPYPYYAALRREAPVHQVPGLGIWAVSRHADVLAVLRDHERFSSAAMAAVVRRPAAYAPAGNQEGAPDPMAAAIIGADPPAHTRLRTIVSRAFTPRRIAELEPRIREIARGLVARFAAAGECDVVGDYGVELPIAVIAALLGIDPDRHRDFKRWSDALMHAVFDTPAPEELEEIGRTLEEVNTYVEEVIAARHVRPADDLIGTLVRAESLDGALSADEVKIFVFTLLVAGNVTTTHLIANATLALLAHPEELARVQRAPQLIPPMIEEGLRYDPPVQFLFRTATCDVDLAGVTIPQGAMVAPLFASANRDERVFADPDRFDVTRNPKDHLAFGHGLHFCLGAALARLEARVAFEELLPRLGHPTRVDDQLTWTPALTMRGPTALRLRFQPTTDRRPVRVCAPDPESVVRRFIEAWSRLDPAELAAYFTEDGTYHNVPLAPVRGRASIEAMIRAFTSSWTETRWDIVTLLSSGDVVVAERIDRTRAGDRAVDLPIVGVFELERGRIKAWRDYFNLSTYTEAMA